MILRGLLNSSTGAHRTLRAAAFASLLLSQSFVARAPAVAALDNRVLGPKNFTASAAKGGVSLTWSAVPNATQYMIRRYPMGLPPYRDPAITVAALMRATPSFVSGHATSYFDSSMQTGTDGYIYLVNAVVNNVVSRPAEPSCGSPSATGYISGLPAGMTAARLPTVRPRVFLGMLGMGSLNPYGAFYNGSSDPDWKYVRTCLDGTWWNLQNDTLSDQQAIMNSLRTRRAIAEVDINGPGDWENVSSLERTNQTISWPDKLTGIRGSMITEALGVSTKGAGAWDYPSPNINNEPANWFNQIASYHHVPEVLLDGYNVTPLPATAAAATADASGSWFELNGSGWLTGLWATWIQMWATAAHGSGKTFTSFVSSNNYYNCVTQASQGVPCYNPSDPAYEDWATVAENIYKNNSSYWALGDRWVIIDYSQRYPAYGAKGHSVTDMLYWALHQ